MKINYLITKESLHVSFDGKHFALGSAHRNFNQIKTLIKEDRLNEIPDVLERSKKKLEEYIVGSGLTLNDGKLYDSTGNELPYVLNNRLQELKSEGLPVTPLVKFWYNLKLNPSMNSRQQLYKFLEQNGHPLTEDGHFIAYRGVTADLKDKHTKTFDNSPGSVCEMKRSQVDDNPSVVCSKGLHVAAFEYARNFSPTTVEVKVNPRDVVSVPNDYNGQKMRVCRFEVLQLCESQNNQTLYGHNAYEPWDDIDDVEEEFDSEDIIDVILSAVENKDRYKDRSVLAARIQEDVDLLISEILEILNTYESDWK
jgi:hypothetical protein